MHSILNRLLRIAMKETKPILNKDGELFNKTVVLIQAWINSEDWKTYRPFNEVLNSYSSSFDSLNWSEYKGVTEGHWNLDFWLIKFFSYGLHIRFTKNLMFSEHINRKLNEGIVMKSSFIKKVYPSKYKKLEILKTNKKVRVLLEGKEDCVYTTPFYISDNSADYQPNEFKKLKHVIRLKKSDPFVYARIKDLLRFPSLKEEVVSWANERKLSERQMIVVTVKQPVNNV